MRYFLILFLIGIISCNSNNKETIPSVNELEKIDFTDGENVLLDVRSPEEFAEGHIPDAVNLDVNGDNFEKEISELDPSKTYYVYCHSGTRSTRACSKLEKAGFKNLVNLKDGYSAYQKN